MAASRSASSHHGVRRAIGAGSGSPARSAVPGNVTSRSAGGTARSSSHRTGSAISAVSTHGAANPIGPSVSTRATPQPASAP